MKLPTVAAVAVVVVVVVVAVVDGIRVYEGTNLTPSPSVRLSDVGSYGNSSRGREASSRVDDDDDDDGRQFATTNLVKYSKELKATPNLYKVKLTQSGYLQFLRYLADVPPLREFTFCLWFVSRNLTHPHPLFSYSIHDRARLLSLWYQPEDATVRMSIREDLAFKVPAIIREDAWHHLCTSWNGIHGEWMLFLDGLKIGSGRIRKYKGTYVPGGGEVVVGQEPTDLHRGLDDGIEGEVFAFNMVDESVLDEIVFLKSRYAPVAEKAPEAIPVPAAYVPPFKQLPPMKTKSYQEIKAYITSLPSKPHVAKTPPPPPPPPPPSVANRKPSRKGKPARKAATRKPSSRSKQRPRKPPPPPVLRKAVIYGDRRSLSRKMGEANTERQIYDENYSVHSYRAPNDRDRSARYEIYEEPEEEEEEERLPRVPRHNFDVHTARRGNDMYVRSIARAAKPRRPAYHFEVAAAVKAGRRSLELGKATPIAARKIPLDVIPVYEIIQEDEDDDDDGLLRRKRSIADDLTAGFRPLPNIPSGFIDIFSASGNDANEVFASANRRNLVLTAKDLERRPGISAGTELVRRSFEECVADRGSPVRDKDRFVVSWAETPVRIYGGAVVTAAEPLCGHF